MSTLHEQAENIIATLREPFLVLDRDLRVVAANRSFYKNFHVTPEETQGSFVYDLGNRQWDVPALRTLLEKVLPRNHSIDDFEVEHNFPTIGQRIMLLNARRIRKPGSSAELILLAIDDITVRRKAELVVAEAGSYAESIVETVREPLVVLGADLRVKSANAAFYRTFHVSQVETVNHLIYDLGNRQWNIPKLRTLLEEVLPQNNSLDDFEVEHNFPAIGQRIMLLNARRIYRKDNQTELILLAIEDITERKRAEAAMKDSEVRYRRLFESARDGILILNAGNGKVIDANPFMTELLGYASDELIDKELWEIGLFKDRDASRAAFRQLQEAGYIRYDDLPLETKHGQKVEVEFVSNAYRVDSTTVIQCNIRSITEHRQLERMRIQTQALSDLHRRKDEFLAMLSHELRNPLAPIVNAVQLLGFHKNNGNPIEEQARTIIERQAGQLKHLVDDLLEVSRVSTGGVRLHMENVDMRGIVERALESVRSLIDQNRHDLAVSLPSKPVWLHADSTRVEQVIVNLLNNAAKYTNEGGHITLTLAQEKDEAVLRVRDTGVGIPTDMLPRIFDLFTQAERSLDRSQGGLGIGLTIVQKLVDLHGGRVAAYSEMGVGSEFVVRFPVLHMHTRQRPTSTEPVPTRSPRCRRVLVVDDNVDQADSAAMLLRLFGHDVQVTYSGAFALEVAAQFRPDIVLMDIGLPEMDGYQVARRMRGEPGFKETVLVAMTGYGQETDRQRSREAGFNHHLVKPIDMKQLEEILAALS